MLHTSFATTTRGLDCDLPLMRLYEKAKRPGIWNPSEIDLSRHFERLEKARGASLEDMQAATRNAVDREDA